MTDAPTPLLYPEIEPYDVRMLNVGDGHSLYVEQSGNPNGLPVVMLHGGPGSGCKPKHRQMFDPQVYRVVIFDQRGCGRSQPAGRVVANTTDHLVADIEMIRETLGIESWVVYGNSWGSALGLAYAEAHPERVKGLVIGAIFTATQRELDWFYDPAGLARFFPDAYAALRDVLGNPAWHDMPRLIRDAVLNDDAHALAVAKATVRLDALSMDLEPDMLALEEYLDSEDFSLTPLRIWAHYFAAACFLSPQQLLKNVGRIAHIPMHITHAGLDLCCPPETAYALHKALPDAAFTFVPVCGHRANDAMDKARMEALRDMAIRVRM